MQGWAKIRQASKYAGISERTMRDWFKQGLKFSKLSTGTILIFYKDIDVWLEGFAVNNDQVDQIVDEVCKNLRLPNSNE